MNTEPISIYIHWPYCLSLCPYCDFNSHLLVELDQVKWLNAYKTELNYFQAKLAKRYIKSIFFGGGTPSLMPAALVAGIIEHLSQIGKLDQATEITLEANPTSFETKKFREFKLAGINRVSIGIQSLKDDYLKLLGRQHDALQARQAIEAAAKIFSRYSFDLIYALPGQSLINWQEELTASMQLSGDHISLYQLTIEPGTYFNKLFRSGRLKLPEAEIAANMYEHTEQYLTKFGYHKYEISNYAKLGQECRHNLAYWYYEEYIGIGPGAHSRWQEKDKQAVIAMMMFHKPEKWLASVNEKGHGLQQKRSLTKLEIIEEMLMMGTRLSRGLAISKLENMTNRIFEQIINQQNFQHYLDNGFIFKNEKYFGFTNTGLLLQNYLLPRLIKDKID